MKIVIIILAIVIVASAFTFLRKKNKDSVREIPYGPFIIKIKTTSHRKLTQDYKIGTEFNVSYSIWLNGKAISFKGEEKNYTDLWKVYILAGTPKPTLLAGGEGAYLVSAENGKAVITSLKDERDDFASLQFLDGTNEQAGEFKNAFRDNQADSIETIKGGNYLLISQRLVLHIPDLKIHHFAKQEPMVDGYYVNNAQGIVASSPDKKSVVYIASKNDDGQKYTYAMIVYDCYETKAYSVPYNLTQTRSIEIAYDDRAWFKTYFEWIKDSRDNYTLQLRKYDVLPFWSGSFTDYGKVYQLKPVKNEMQQIFADFVLKELNLTKDAIQPGGQYTTNMMVISYKNYKFNLWLRPDEQVLILMRDSMAPESEQEQINIIHELGENFNKELSLGRYQDYFTQL